ncbi:MAG TPA: cytochrome-c peroxidase [Rhodobacteraceae bacterium]|nr:cytochrome-c peroxidase [Paracoccaceae bacterium]
MPALRRKNKSPGAVLVALSLAVAGTAVLAQDFPLPKADAVFPAFPADQVQLGQMLFYDPILSGNRNVACATCHNPRFGTSDGVSLGIGDGGIGLGPDRRPDPANPPERRIARNSPSLFNLGAAGFRSLFHDGRLESDPARPGGIRTPMGEAMEQGFHSVLAAQAMFPVLAADEMAGHRGENDVSKAVSRGLITGPGGAWDIIAKRVSGIPEYRQGFDAVIGRGQPVRFTNIANAIAAFVATEWRADNSPFDRYLRGEGDLSPSALRGMELFYGPAGCAACHSGQFQTDHAFHAIAMPQIGPGKAAEFENHHRDEGRLRVTGHPEDAYRFRTASLRNITRTAPYGHDGAYSTLTGVIRHHLDPVASLKTYGLASAVLPDMQGIRDDWVMSRPDEIAAIAAANELAPKALAKDEVSDLAAFLRALEDPGSLAGRLGIPDQVPSGLPVPR